MANERTGVGQVKQIIAIAAGKGGVGKSTVAGGLASALAKLGKTVGLLDADLYGPSLPQMLGAAEGIKLISMAHLRKGALALRAPMANQVLGRFIREAKWGALDYLIVDFPPGTGDIQLTLCQQLNFSAAILVRTPQSVVEADVKRAEELFRQVGVPVLGVVENMSYFEAGGERHHPFGAPRGEGLLSLPLESALAASCDKGELGKHAQLFEPLAQRLLGVAEAPLALERVEQKGANGLCFVWRGGDQSEKLAPDLQRLCPCAACEGRGEVREDVAVTQVERVGRYGLRFAFTSGCSEGIYDNEMLR